MALIDIQFVSLFGSIPYSHFRSPFWLHRCNSFFPSPLRLLNSNLENIHADFKVAFIGTNTNTEMVIKMNKSEGTALLFGRTAGNKPIGAIITHDNAANLGTGGTYTVNDGVITCSLGAYAAGYLLYNRSCIESISYS